MRSIIKLLGLAFIATLAFSAVGAIGAGSASALLFLTLSPRGQTELLFELKSLTKPIFLSASGNFECALLLGRGAILHKTDEARKILLQFHGCKLEGTSTTCTTAGEPAGLITTLLLDALLVTLLEVPLQETKYALKLLSEVRPPHLATFSCGIITVILRGSVVGDFEESLRQSQTHRKEAALLFGRTVSQDFWTLKSGIGEAKLEWSFGGGAFEPVAVDVLVDIIADGLVGFCHN
jgi:hypothetical protein